MRYKRLKEHPTKRNFEDLVLEDNGSRIRITSFIDSEAARKAKLKLLAERIRSPDIFPAWKE